MIFSGINRVPAPSKREKEKAREREKARKRERMMNVWDNMRTTCKESSAKRLALFETNKCFTFE